MNKIAAMIEIIGKTIAITIVARELIIKRALSDAVIDFTEKLIGLRNILMADTELSLSDVSVFVKNVLGETTLLSLIVPFPN